MPLPSSPSPPQTPCPATPPSHSPSLRPLFTSSLSLSLPGHKTGGPGEVSCAGVGVELRSMWRTGPRDWPGPAGVGSTWQGRVLLDANGYIYFHIFQNEHGTGWLRARNHILRELGGRLWTTGFLSPKTTCKIATSGQNERRESWTKHKPSNRHNMGSSLCRGLWTNTQWASSQIYPFLWLTGAFVFDWPPIPTEEGK